jgi:hypothetical protein
MMLRYCTMLEVCHLVHVRPYSEEYDIYDSEEPNVTHRTKGRPSKWFDELAQREFEMAKTNTSWPTCSLEPPYSLPSLHTFHIDNFNPRISQLNMPALRHLGLWDGEVGTIADDILSCCSSFPYTLTHLSFGGYAVPLELILNVFPYITKLCFHYTWEKSAQSAVKSRHTSLTVIKYVCHGSTENMAYHVGDLLSVIESGMLPALREVSIVRWKGKGRKDEKLPVEKFQILGVVLVVKFVKPFGQYKVEGVIRLPDYLYYQ